MADNRPPRRAEEIMDDEEAIIELQPDEKGD